MLYWIILLLTASASSMGFQSNHPPPLRTVSRSIATVLVDLDVAVSFARPEIPQSDIPDPTLSRGAATTLITTMTIVQITDPAATHTVQVSQRGSVLISPNRVDAPPGDVVLFKYTGSNCTLKRTTLEHPCVPASMTGDLRSVSNGTRIGIESEEPLFFFCDIGADGRCSMHNVFAINPQDEMSAFLRRVEAQRAPVTASAASGLGPFPTNVSNVTMRRTVSPQADLSNLAPSRWTFGAKLVSALGTIFCFLVLV